MFWNHILSLLGLLILLNKIVLCSFYMKWQHMLGPIYNTKRDYVWYLKWHFISGVYFLFLYISSSNHLKYVSNEFIILKKVVFVFRRTKNIASTRVGGRWWNGLLMQKQIDINTCLVLKKTEINTTSYSLLLKKSVIVCVKLDATWLNRDMYWHARKKTGSLYRS